MSVGGIGIAGNARLAAIWLPLWQAAGIKARAWGEGHAQDFGAAPGSCADAAAFAAGLKVLFVCSDDLMECEAILFDGPAFARIAPDLHTIVIAATLPPRFTKALRGRVPQHIALVDAPWSGTTRMAQRGALAMLLGGPSDAVDAVEPLLAPLAAATERMGCFGSAMAAKVMKDFLAASSTAMTRLALDWAQAQGIEERRLLEVIEGARTGIAGGADLRDGPIPSAPQLSEGVMAALVKDVESAFDAALAGASLTPPHALRQVIGLARGRALH